MWTKEHVHALLDASPRAVYRALQALYARQTADEQQMQYTAHANGVGFNKRDAEWLSDIARKSKRFGTLTERQLNAVRPRMKFYARQLVEIANAEAKPVPPQLEALMARRPAPATPDLPLTQDDMMVAVGDHI
jgi:hypothetical protein